VQIAAQDDLRSEGSDTWMRGSSARLPASGIDLQSQPSFSVIA